MQYIYDDMKGLENPLSHRAAEELKTAERSPGTATSTGSSVSCTSDLSIKEGLDWREDQRRSSGLRRAWNVFPNLILLPNQGSAFGYRTRPLRLDPDSCRSRSSALDQVPVADYDKRRDFKPQLFEDYRDAGLGVVFNQDLANAKEVTVGMHSPSFDGHRLSEDQEMTIYNHHRVADRFIWAD